MLRFPFRLSYFMSFKFVSTPEKSSTIINFSPLRKSIESSTLILIKGPLMDAAVASLIAPVLRVCPH